MNTSDRLGCGLSWDMASASFTTATVPDASSSAPLQIESPPRAWQPSPALGVPRWSMWPVKNTYSFLSTGSEPSRMPMTLGALRWVWPCCTSRRVACTSGGSRMRPGALRPAGEVSMATPAVPRSLSTLGRRARMMGGTGAPPVES